MKQSPARHVVVTNLTPFDQNFALVLMPGENQSIPNIGGLAPVIWTNAIVPAVVSGIASQADFSWHEDFTVVLGSAVSGHDAKFTSATTVPVSIGAENSVTIGYTGSHSAGAPKLIETVPEPGDFFSLKTNSSIPVIHEQDPRKQLAFAWGMTTDSGDGGAAMYGHLLPNTKTVLYPAPRYSILTVPFEAAAGDRLQNPFVEAAYPIDFSNGSTRRLAFLGDNRFSLL